MTDRTPMIAGNWKMNLSRDESVQLIKGIKAGIQGVKNVDVMVAPPFINIDIVKQAIGNSEILLSAQNMHKEGSGAFTGEVSGDMLKEAGCTHVILGHSERRTLFGETNESVNFKLKSAIIKGLIPVVCIGETISEREAGKTFDVIRDQLEGSLECFVIDKIMLETTILAYEPVWAIGTGKTATPEQAQEVHHYIRQWLTEKFGSETADKIRILYGGSVKSDNVSELMAKPDIDGGLVGGASLKADSFLGIIRFQAGK